MGNSRVYHGRAVDRGGSPIAGAAFMIENGTAPTPEIACRTDEKGRFAIALPTGEFQAALHTAKGYVARADLHTHKLASHFLFQLPINESEENDMDHGIASVSNSSPAAPAPLGSVSNTSSTELEAVVETPRILAASPGSAGAATGPGISGPNLLVRGTQPFQRSLGRRSVLESILGDDERVRILDTQVAPWRMICSLIMKTSNGTYLGTGWFAGPRTIITAGHCVFDSQMGGWANEITIIPARNGSQEPFGRLVSKSFSTTDRWKQEQNPDFDYSAIHLGPEAEAITKQTGWFSTVVVNDAGLKGQRVNISGYPGDKGKGDLQAAEQWFHAKQIVYLTPQRIYYDVDTMGGQSGAPSWLDTDDGPKVVGIHAYGVNASSALGIQANSAPRITDEVFKVIKGWIEKA